MKCVSVRLGNVIGQDIWELGSICWGAVVEKLMLMWGVWEDDTKGKHNPFTTSTYTVVAFSRHLRHTNYQPVVYRRMTDRTTNKRTLPGSLFFFCLSTCPPDLSTFPFIRIYPSIHVPMYPSMYP